MVRRNTQPMLTDLFNDFFENDFANRFDRSFKVLPKTNVIEEERMYNIEMMVPGYKKEDFSLNIENDTLVISAQKEQNNEEKDGKKIVFREYSVQSFERSFRLSNDVDANKIEASYQDGILHVTIPKKAEAVVKKLIKIK
ncbi:MAG: Hsp20/alpha crystallin family protein [Bacteroidales bacterium]|nr:Hsp20/alpha crystallin family protein [Bacteroidales bacterium]